MTNTNPGTDVAVTIGGETVAVPPMSFAALKRAWPAIVSLPEQPHVVAQAASVIEIVASALERVRPDLTAIEIEARLIGREFLDLMAKTSDLLAASGLVAPKEAGPAGEAGEPPPAGTPPIGTIASPAASVSASAAGTTSSTA